MKELVESIARALVDHPDDVQVKSIEGAQATILELRVHKEDLGKVIGRQGRTAKAVRTLLGAAGVRLTLIPDNTLKSVRNQWRDHAVVEFAGFPWLGDCFGGFFFFGRMSSLRRCWRASSMKRGVGPASS